MPIWVLDEIDKIRRNFLWNGSEPETNKIHLANWELICKPKKFGGLGVIDLRTFNNALLAKWYWQWITPERRVWKSLYHVISTEQRSMLPNYSFFQKTIIQAISFCVCFTTRIIGNGESIQFWSHDWGLGRLKHVYPELYSKTTCPFISVKAVFTMQNIAQMFITELSTDDVQQLNDLAMRLSHQPDLTTRGHIQDGAQWNLTSSGIFTVKSAYLGMKNENSIQSHIHIHRIWKLNVPPKMKTFAWLLIQNKILTVDNLIKRGWSLPNICIMCKRAAESVMHLFEECPQSIAIQIMALNRFSITYDEVRRGNTTMIQSLMSNDRSKKTKEITLITLFIIWRERCTRIFREQSKTQVELAEEVYQQWLLLGYNRSST